MNDIFKKALIKSIEIGGTLVDADHATERYEACIKCPNYAKVKGKVLGFEMEYDGCKLCLCPIETKVRMDVIASQVHLKAMQSYQEANGATVKTIKEKNSCSDSENDRWHDIDLKYSTRYK